MPIPTLFDITLPLLKLMSDEKPRPLRILVEELGLVFDLTETEKTEYLPSGAQKRFDNRVGWARTELKFAGLVEPADRSDWRITHQGLEVLKEPPDRIDIGFLRRFEGYVENAGLAPKSTATTGSGPTTTISGLNEKMTPEEAIEAGYNAFKSQLAEEILSAVLRSPPDFFERLVVDLLVRMGYGGSQQDAGEAVGRSGDGGIDGVIKEDRLGLATIQLQAKRWSTVVGRPEIQRFAGAILGKKTQKGVFITTSTFSREAKEYAEGIGATIILIDGARLSDLMIEFDVGVVTTAAFELKRLDRDFFPDQ